MNVKQDVFEEMHFKAK